MLLPLHRQMVSTHSNSPSFNYVDASKWAENKLASPSAAHYTGFTESVHTLSVIFGILIAIHVHGRAKV